jgi:hypothetical protein
LPQKREGGGFSGLYDKPKYLAKELILQSCANMAAQW